MTLIVSSADEAAIAENNSFIIYRASQSVIEGDDNGFHDSYIPFKQMKMVFFDRFSIAGKFVKLF